MRGFTLIELMISMAIMLILSGILFARYPETVKRLTLANTTHTVALLIREAQVRGSAVDSVNSTLGGYGVYASLTNPTQLILFGDVVDGTVSRYQIATGDGLYQSGGSTPEAKTTVRLPTGYTIVKLCTGSGFPFTCSVTTTTLTISFIRPDPQPNIYVNASKATNFSAGCIELRSPLAPLPGHVRSVQVFNSGMIRTQVGKCDNSAS